MRQQRDVENTQIGAPAREIRIAEEMRKEKSENEKMK